MKLNQRYMDRSSNSNESQTLETLQRVTALERHVDGYKREITELREEKVALSEKLNSVADYKDTTMTLRHDNRQLERKVEELLKRIESLEAGSQSQVWNVNSGTLTLER